MIASPCWRTREFFPIMKTMNKTETTCFHFTGISFDNVQELFLTNVLTCILNLLFGIITFMGNSTILLAIKKDRGLHSPSFALLGCTAASDPSCWPHMSATFRGIQDSRDWKELHCVLLVKNASGHISLDYSGHFVLHICHRFSSFASHSGYLDLVPYIECGAKVLDDRRMVFHPVGHFCCCIHGSNRQYNQDISDGSKTPAPDK